MEVRGEVWADRAARRGGRLAETADWYSPAGAAKVRLGSEAGHLYITE